MKTKSKKSSLKQTTNSTVNTIIKQNKLESFFANIICIMLFVVFGYIAIMSFLQTSVIDPEKYASEVILYQNDIVVLNILFTVLFTVFVFRMKKHYDFFAKINIKHLEIGLVAYTVILGFIWIFSVTSIPAADSYNIFETATQASQGNYNSMHNNTNFYNNEFYNGYSYYNFYPFQLGIVFISEIVYRLFGTSSAMPLQVINVLCLAVSYLAIAKITRLLFNKRSIEFIAILMLAGCFQPILFCTFSYGNIIGMSCAICASYFLIKYFKTSKYVLLLPCAVLLVLATLAKYNNMIYLIAFVIVLIIHTVKAKKWQSIAFALALCVATVGTSNLVIMSYESRAKTEFNNGLSQVLYLDMGLNESHMAPGWFNMTALNTYINSGLDNKLANQTAKNDIKARLDTMGNDLGYTIDFFGKKIISQWNEPTFESIWVSEVKQHYKDINFIGKSMYEGSLGQFFEMYFNLYMPIIYLLFAIGIYLLFLKKKASIENVLLPLVILGAFGYHLLFEGKSQYILTYIILFIPSAAYGLENVINGKYTKIKEIVGQLKTVHQDSENNI